MKKDFSHIDTRIYDLDGTIYDFLSYASPRMVERMNEFLAKQFNLPLPEAAELRNSLYKKHGATMIGLVKEHKIYPGTFLSYTHGFDISPLVLDEGLKEKLEHVKERQLIFTSAPLEYAERLTRHWGIRSCFEAIYAIEDADYNSKSEIETYKGFLKKFDIDPTRAMMHEDTKVNLIPAHALGMTNILIHGVNDPPEALAHIHHVAPRLVDWMNEEHPKKAVGFS